MTTLQKLFKVVFDWLGFLQTHSVKKLFWECLNEVFLVKMKEQESALCHLLLYFYRMPKRFTKVSQNLNFEILALFFGSHLPLNQNKASMIFN